MAVGNGYTTNIRTALQDKGIVANRIGFSPTTGVTVDGQGFARPDKTYGGSPYTSPTKFAESWQQYSQKTPTNLSNTTSMSGMSSTQPYAYNAYANNQGINNNPYSQQADQIIQQLMNYNQNQQPFDPYSTSSYQAAQAQASRAAQQNTRAAQEAYGSAGFGRSTALGERVAGINNDATQYLMTQVLPQIEAQEQARRQQEYNNTVSTLQQLLDQQRRADDLVQQDYDNRFREGESRGNVISPEASDIINQLLNLKGNTEANWMTMTPEQRTTARTQGDSYRNQLQAMGYDPTLFGADVNAASARQNQGIAGRTIGGRSQDLAERQQAYNEGLTTRQQDFNENLSTQQQDLNKLQTYATLTGYMPDGTPTNAKQQQELQNLWIVADYSGTIPKQLADLYGLPEGTPTQAAKQFAEQQSLAWFNANTSRQNANQGNLMDIWRNSGMAPTGISGVEPGTPLYDQVGQRQASNAGQSTDTAESMRTYFDNMARYDKGKLTNASQLEEAILLSPLSDYEAYKTFLRYGLKWDGEIPKQGK